MKSIILMKVTLLINMTLITTTEEFYIPLFLKYGDFGPLNALRASLAVRQKNTPFYAFWSRMCTMSYLTPPPRVLDTPFHPTSLSGWVPS